MKNYNLKLKAFLTGAAAISVVFTIVILIIFKEVNCESFLTVLLHIGLILMPLTFLYFYFDKWGWRQWIGILLRQVLRFPPDIRGRWEGKLIRTNPDHYESKFVLEVEQTMSNLQVYTYTQDNESVSILDDFACDINHDKNFKLCFLWEGTGTKLPNQKEDSGKFSGYTILKIIESKNKRELIGHYFTDRKPDQTQGKIELKWVSKELKRKF